MGGASVASLSSCAAGPGAPGAALAASPKLRACGHRRDAHPTAGSAAGPPCARSPPCSSGPAWRRASACPISRLSASTRYSCRRRRRPSTSSTTSAMPTATATSASSAAPLRSAPPARPSAPGSAPPSRTAAAATPPSSSSARRTRSAAGPGKRRPAGRCRSVSRALTTPWRSGCRCCRTRCSPARWSSRTWPSGRT